MKILKPYYILLFLLIAGAVTILGCSKAQVENKLEGRWSKVPVDDLSRVLPWEHWEFVGDAEFNYYYSANGTDTLKATGTYEVESYREVSLKGVVEDGFPDFYQGAWRIIKLKKGQMILVKEDQGLSFMEFTKL